MSLIIFLKDIIFWHYSRAYADIFHIWLDILYFVSNYFSVPLLLRTFFGPWRRMGEIKKGYFDPRYFIIDILMRIVGMLVRGLTILVGFCAIFLCFSLLPAILAIWTTFPFLIIFSFYSGIIYLFF